MKINKKNIACRVIDNKAFLITLHDRHLHELNETGTRVWELLTARESVSEITAAITAEFNVTPAEAEKDITEFINGLNQKGLICE